MIRIAVRRETESGGVPAAVATRRIAVYARTLAGLLPGHDDGMHPTVEKPYGCRVQHPMYPSFRMYCFTIFVKNLTKIPRANPEKIVPIPTPYIPWNNT